MIHGGPTGQWPVTFAPRIAYWVDRGWDVLLPDHRGSTGHGRAYQQALNGRWGELDVTDTIAWIDHAQASGWCEPARTVVMGGSSGAYTVLGVLGRRPGRVAGGIALYPVTDLADLAARSHRFEAHSTERLVGPLSDAALYAARSAGSLVGRIVDPLLVLHGTTDPVVPVEGTIAFVEAMRATGGEVELHLFEGEGHGFRQPENQLAEYRLIEEFMRRVPATRHCAEIASTAVSEWDPNDPESVKVHYDVSAWSLDQRAELTEALADAELPHSWDGDELIVPEDLEGQVDELFERLEELLGPFAVQLDPDDAGVEYGLDEWPPADRQTLAQALVEAAVPHRWQGPTVIVATDSEAAVDELLDGVEQGTLVLSSGGTTGPPEGALGVLFTSADRLARDPDDRGGRDDLRGLVGQLDRSQPPYGVSIGTWAKAVDTATTLGSLIDDDSSPPSDIIGAAQNLRALVREYV